ncbi:hypothetical protein INT47_010169 [Mucor saturninus]|uniref:Uncharacterized protein n=1 Tax=Mucor saturninus TaxID=64648 RepID=A0A8H7RD51_9FUNG|nr:hypothetical protein INT47_010169 [Mucor saturninus]
MGHTPASYTLKELYAGKFESLDMTTLVTTGEVVQGHTIDPLLNPAIFHIKDISLYKLTDGEIREGVDGDERVTDLFNTRTKFIKELNKSTGPGTRAEVTHSTYYCYDVSFQ